MTHASLIVGCTFYLIVRQNARFNAGEGLVEEDVLSPSPVTTL
jgi:hypothetical protein